MLKSSTTLVTAACVLVGFGLALSAPDAQARPKYLQQFVKKYPNLKAAATAKKCACCHDSADKKKKTRNDYGKAVGAGIVKKNEKNEAAIIKALSQAEQVKSKKTGMTFGEMIKAGKLPE